MDDDDENNGQSNFSEVMRFRKIDGAFSLKPPPKTNIKLKKRIII